MSELDQSVIGASPDDPLPVRHEDLVGLVGDRPAVEREGLPRTYRMRADSHYLDQLESPRGGPAIRLIPPRHIAADDPSPSIHVGALTQSIAAHGVLQPLLVRRHNGQYQLIAGRKRLAAAVAADITEVPCLIYDVTETEASSLAKADNVRGTAADHLPPVMGADCLRQVFGALSVELAGMVSSAALLGTTPGSALQRRVAADLIQAQAWRAAWMASAVAILTGQRPESRRKSIAAILDRIKTGFDAEARLTRLHLDCSATPAAAALVVDEELGAIAVTGCVFATLSWLEGHDEPRVEVRVDAPNPRTLRTEVVQRMTPVQPELARGLREPEFSGLRDVTSALGLTAARLIAEQFGGAVELTAITGRGSVIQGTFCRPDGN